MIMTVNKNVDTLYVFQHIVRTVAGHIRFATQMTYGYHQVDAVFFKASTSLCAALYKSSCERKVSPRTLKGFDVVTVDGVVNPNTPILISPRFKIVRVLGAKACLLHLHKYWQT